MAAIRGARAQHQVCGDQTHSAFLQPGRDVHQEGWYLFFMAFSIYGWHTAPFTHFCAEGQMRQQAGLMARVPSPPPGSRCWAGVCTAQLRRRCQTSFPLLKQSHSELPAARQTHPSVLGRDQLLSLPPQCQAAGLLLSTCRPPHISPHPPASALSFLQSASILKGNSLP